MYRSSGDELRETFAPDVECVESVSAISTMLEKIFLRLGVQAAGDIYHEQPLKRTVRFLWQKLTKGSSNISCLLTDLGSLYLTNMLNFYGVKDISSIYVEGADKYPKKRAEILANALKNAKIEAEKF